MPNGAPATLSAATYQDMPLKFVITRLDSMVGSRVALNGMLIGAGGADGINVTEVSRVAVKCPWTRLQPSGRTRTSESG